jgi:hypothetical protein
LGGPPLKVWNNTRNEIKLEEHAAAGRGAIAGLSNQINRTFCSTR